MDNNWSSGLLKLGNTEVTLLYSVTIPLMDNKELTYYIIVLTGITWQAPYIFNAIIIQDINQSA